MRFGLAGIFLPWVVTWVQACSSGDARTPRAEPPSYASGTSTGGVGSGGGSGTGAGGSSIVIAPPDGVSDASTDGTCASTGAKATPNQVDIYVMLDQSGSMQGGGANSGLRWDPVTAALKGFIGDPRSAGLGIGIQYFPLGMGTGSPDPDKCLVSKYQQPDVPVGVLPGHASALITSIDAHHFTTAEANLGPHFGTPTRPALEGAVDFVRDWMQKNPSHAGVVVLATDGYPSSSMCAPEADDMKSVVAIAQMAAAWTPPVRTYVIGIGDVKNLNQVAVAGGTGQAAFVIDATSQQTQQQFADALDAVRTSVIPCEYPIPATDPGRFDVTQVNVQYTPGSASAPILVGKANDPVDCQGRDGWYYDQHAQPRTVVMCPAMCAKLQLDRGASIDVLFGCPTIVIH
ncbi:MAG: hypothetical protein QOE09_1912 [Ilumatobacteraceae bacterium]